MTKWRIGLAVLVAGTALGVPHAATAHSGNKPVTPENHIRAEVDFAFADFQKNAGGKINTFYYIRKPTPLNEQAVVRMNLDTLYAAAVVDTKAAPP